MLDQSLVLWPLLILLALLMGFVADRTNLCTISAVAEILTERRACSLPTGVGATMMFLKRFFLKLEIC